MWRIFFALKAAIVTTLIGKVKWKVPFTSICAEYTVFRTCEPDKGATAAPLSIPAAPQRNRCSALRSPPDRLPAVGSTRDYSSHPWDSPLRGQRKRCSKLLPAILSCLVSPPATIHGVQPLSSGLRFADFSGDSTAVPHSRRRAGGGSPDC